MSTEDNYTIRVNKNRVISFPDKENKEYDFLGTFYESPFISNGQKFNSVEQAMCWHKLKGRSNLAEQILKMANPMEMRKFTESSVKSHFKTSEHNAWNTMRDKTMLVYTKNKFDSNDVLAEKLIETENSYLQANVKDLFWGQYYDKKRRKERGRNKLGEILMQIRQEIYKEWQQQEEDNKLLRKPLPKGGENGENEGNVDGNGDDNGDDNGNVGVDGNENRNKQMNLDEIKKKSLDELSYEELTLLNEETEDIDAYDLEKRFADMSDSDDSDIDNTKLGKYTVDQYIDSDSDSNSELDLESDSD